LIKESLRKVSISLPVIKAEETSDKLKGETTLGINLPTRLSVPFEKIKELEEPDIINLAFVPITSYYFFNCQLQSLIFCISSRKK
jgi:hypothetical protein